MSKTIHNMLCTMLLMVMVWIDLSDKSVLRQKLNDTLCLGIHVDSTPPFALSNYSGICDGISA
jgi:hypothetical protein